MSQAATAPDATRLASRRFFNLFRLIVAGLMLVAGDQLGLGVEAPQLFILLAMAYVALALLLGLPLVTRSVGFDRLVVVQFAIDIVVLATVLWISGGFGSGIAVLMMVYLAAAGLLAEGRMALFFAALATLAVLAENAWRYLAGLEAGEFLQVALVCIGFFAIAFTARLLALRARRSETLAEVRGEALDRQQAINERIIEDMNDGVLVIGADGRLRQTNPRAAQLLGMALTKDMAIADVDTALAEAGRVDEETPRRLGPAGKLLRCRSVAAGTAAEGGDRVVYLTDFEEIEQQFQQHKLAALGRLTASMAHEIRNPLSSVSHAAELLPEEKRADVRARLAQIITDNARRIERMVREVLALGRRGEAVREVVNPAAMLSDIIDELCLGNPDRRALVRLEVDETLRIVMDRAHFHQIFDNLLTNALRHCSGEPGAVWVFSQHQAGASVVLHVQDDGSGVEPVRREAVFEPFFTTEPKGTGLGLYIARELAEANQARLTLADAPGGAHFVLVARSHT